MSQFKLQDARGRTDIRTGSVPALELISRAASSVGVMYRSHGPNTGSNPGEGQIPEKSLNSKVSDMYTLIVR